jgi:truncated hemoglobin YjbI
MILKQVHSFYSILTEWISCMTATALAPRPQSEADDKEKLQQRLDFMEMTPEMLEVLATSQETIRKILPAQLDYFYAHLAKWPEVSAFFKTDQIRQHAKTE